MEAAARKHVQAFGGAGLEGCKGLEQQGAGGQAWWRDLEGFRGFKRLKPGKRQARMP